MKALSIRQPWAWAILHAGKRIENRDWAGCDYRGPILLHTGSSVGSIDDFDCAVDSVADAAPLVDCKPLIDMCSIEKFGRWRPLPTLPRGGIVGRARIVAAIHHGPPIDPRQRVWWAGGFALVLADVEPLPFVPWKGALGLFDVPEDYATRAVHA